MPDILTGLRFTPERTYAQIRTTEGRTIELLVLHCAADDCTRTAWAQAYKLDADGLWWCKQHDATDSRTCTHGVRAGDSARASAHVDRCPVMPADEPDGHYPQCPRCAEPVARCDCER